jgi:hypothetical protein
VHAEPQHGETIDIVDRTFHGGTKWASSSSEAVVMQLGDLGQRPSSLPPPCAV